MVVWFFSRRVNSDAFSPVRTSQAALRKFDVQRPLLTSALAEESQSTAARRNPVVALTALIGSLSERFSPSGAYFAQRCRRQNALRRHDNTPLSPLHRSYPPFSGRNAMLD